MIGVLVNSETTWRVTLRHLHAYYCTPPQVRALQWFVRACFGGALLLAFFR